MLEKAGLSYGTDIYHYYVQLRNYWTCAVSFSLGVLN